MTDTNETKQEEIFEIKDLKIGQTGKYNQFRGNSIDDGRRLLFISFDNEYCCVVTDTEWNTIKFGDFRKLKVTDLFISKQLHEKFLVEQAQLTLKIREKDKEIERLKMR